MTHHIVSRPDTLPIAYRLYVDHQIAILAFERDFGTADRDRTDGIPPSDASAGQPAARRSEVLVSELLGHGIDVHLVSFSPFCALLGQPELERGGKRGCRVWSAGDVLGWIDDVAEVDGWRQQLEVHAVEAVPHRVRRSLGRRKHVGLVAQRGPLPGRSLVLLPAPAAAVRQEQRERVDPRRRRIERAAAAGRRCRGPSVVLAPPPADPALDSAVAALAASAASFSRFAAAAAATDRGLQPPMISTGCLVSSPGLGLRTRFFRIALGEGLGEPVGWSSGSWSNTWLNTLTGCDMMGTRDWVADAVGAVGWRSRASFHSTRLPVRRRSTPSPSSA